MTASNEDGSPVDNAEKIAESEDEATNIAVGDVVGEIGVYLLYTGPETPVQVVVRGSVPTDLAHSYLSRATQALGETLNVVADDAMEKVELEVGLNDE
jgi:hypothetical protein